jgi:hypothetical protein
MTPRSQRWIGDYCSTGKVDWPADLRDALAVNRRRVRRSLLKWAATPPALFLLIVAIGFACEPFLSRPTPTPVLVTVAIVFLLVLIVTILCVNDLRKVLSNIHAAERGEQLERFALGNHVLEDVAAANALGLSASLEGIAQTLYVEPRSSLLLQTDDTPLAAPQPVTITEPAASHAPAQSQQHQATIPPIGGTQPLTAAELDELRRYLKATARRQSVFWLIYLALSTGVCVTGYRVAMGLPIREDLDFAILVTVFWVFANVALFRQVLPERRRLWLLRKDMHDGISEVVAGHKAIADWHNAHALDATAVRINPEVVRRLPNSGVWWEVDGVPATWRRV